ncbi:Calcium-activated potassium channel subunit alpha-1 [Phytophthora citrophthora]|uniref:Calcium-activated potassium channel subunit alpha-1 n=1 Tax=Phytophthora citrophthora TaxID=4793 RepID=A0AAD9GXE5_9STRA|nr:Calcium-activated potassium channel subunit alpha-1 [Phytophthora citrophthora]
MRIMIEALNVVLSLVLVAIAIADTYYDPELDEDSETYQAFEVFCTVLFAVDYVMHLFAAQNFLSYLFTPVSIVDFVTIVPVLLTIAIKRLTLNSVLPILRIARIFRILAVLRFYRVMQSHRGFKYQLSVLVFLLLSLILVAAGVFQILEESYYTEQGLDPLEFHQAVYFIFVTLSTVGYGDISPHTTEGQFFVIFVIVVVVTVTPKQVTKLMELSAQQHDYMHSYTLHRRSIHNGGHVIVTGHVRLGNASAFLKEFYRPRQGRVNVDVVFLADKLPSKRLQELLLNVRYRRRTTYLKGSLLHDRDAKRARIAQAGAVFILANKRDLGQCEAIDALSVLQALAIDRFRFRKDMERLVDGNDGVEQQEPRLIRCFTEILSLKHARGLRTITGVEVALNTSQLRTAIVARNVVCPGAIALILNLIYSPVERHLTQGRRSRTPWVTEYAGGLQNLLFPVVLPENFDGLLFEDAAEQLYLRFHVMLVALYDRTAKLFGEKSTRLCPFGERLEENDLVFVIAPSASVAQHAVDSLPRQNVEVECGQYYNFSLPRVSLSVSPCTNHTKPALVFSADTVLDRQSLKDDVPINEIEAEPPRSRSSSSVSSEFSSPQIWRAGDSSCKTSPPLNSLSGRNLHGHIIICGPFDHGQHLACYLDELFTQEKLKRPEIVLFVKTLPSDTEMDAMSRVLPSNVFVQRGLSESVEDLLRVRAFVASRVLFIPSSWDRGALEDVSEDMKAQLEDYQVIKSTLALRTVEDLHHEYIQQQQRSSLVSDRLSILGCSIVKSHNSIKYFAYKYRTGVRSSEDSQSSKSDDEESIADDSDASHSEYPTERVRNHRRLWDLLHFDWKPVNTKSDFLTSPCFTPAYAAGEVFVDCVLDTLLCQSFFNPYVVDLIRALAGDNYFDDSPSDHQATFRASMMRYFSSTNNEENTNALPKSRSPVLKMVTISRELEGAPFAEVFAKGLEQNSLVLGIYRRAQAGSRGNQLPYVVTCPEEPYSCVVERGDQLYVLTKESALVSIR